MKLSVVFACVIAFGFPAAALAQDIEPGRTRIAAAELGAIPASEPVSRIEPSVAPAADPRPEVKPAPRAVRRPPRAAAPAPQPTLSDRISNFFRGNADGVRSDPRGRPQMQEATRNAPSYPTARPPSNKLFLGMFYSVVRKETVAFRENHAPGTIIVRQRERRLYYVLGNGQAIRYAIAVGREGAAWSGVSSVSDKREWPSWTPTPNILKRQPNLPRFMEGGPQNPMGARALYLGDTLYRIHGTNEPWMIGEEASSGCIRMSNDDVVDLYNRTRLGATVIVQR